MYTVRVVMIVMKFQRSRKKITLEKNVKENVKENVKKRIEEIIFRRIVK